MKSVKVLLYMIVTVFFWYHFIFQPSAMAEESLEDSIDCTDVTIDYSDDGNLTQEERLRRMDAAFYESLNRFELCQEAKEQANTTAEASNGGTAGSGGGGGDNETASASESVASSTMSGTDEPKEVKEYPAAEGIETKEPRPLEISEDIEDAESSTTESMARANGKVPEDIPPAKNDDALAAQIRYAAENEPDPEKRRQLWNEYRKYKGLKTK
ncbi:MAG: hypothetical protein QNJ17_05110 [Desulfocapsaceae bacterium]|nr:hypothetical protein [Desulfocapsaceae bacterium]